MWEAARSQLEACKWSAYALALLAAAVTVELHLFLDTFHGSALIQHGAISQRAQAETIAMSRRVLSLSALCFWLISRGDEFVDDPLGGAHRVRAGQPKDEVLEAGIDGATNGFPGDVGLVVGDR